MLQQKRERRAAIKAAQPQKPPASTNQGAEPQSLPEIPGQPFSPSQDSQSCGLPP